MVPVVGRTSHLTPESAGSVKTLGAVVPSVHSTFSPLSEAVRVVPSELSLQLIRSVSAGSEPFQATLLVTPCGLQGSLVAGLTGTSTLVGGVTGQSSVFFSLTVTLMVFSPLEKTSFTSSLMVDVTDTFESCHEGGPEV